MAEYDIFLGAVRRTAYRNALVQMLAASGERCFHVTAELPPDTSRAMLAECLREWAARVDRFYLGRNWAKCDHQKRMKGVVFFETRPYHHAHLVVTPPEGAGPLHFMLYAQFWFAPQEEPLLRRVYPRPVTTDGRMMIQKIEPGGSNLERVLAYDTKEMEYRPSAIEDWKFLDHLTRR